MDPARACAVVVAVAAIACEKHPVEIDYGADEGAFSSRERRALQEVADATLRDVRALLPGLSPRLSLVVQRGKSVIPETGETATAVPPAEVVWTVDPDRDVLATIRTQLRPSLFHELHHLARAGLRPRTLMDHVVHEGMATAFERDFGKADPPWGKAPPEIMEWTQEVLRQPPSSAPADWLYRHPDGRRWVGMRVGTFLVDRAAKASGRTAATLVSASTDEVVGLAAVR